VDTRDELFSDKVVVIDLSKYQLSAQFF